MLSLDRPNLDWSGLAQSMGVSAVKVGNLESLAQALLRSYSSPGPSLIEAIF